MDTLEVKLRSMFSFWAQKFVYVYTLRHYTIVFNISKANYGYVISNHRSFRQTSHQEQN
jgi:hypothetical protein